MEGDVVTMQDIFLYDFGMGLDSTGRYQGSSSPRVCVRECSTRSRTGGWRSTRRCSPSRSSRDEAHALSLTARSTVACLLVLACARVGRHEPGRLRRRTSTPRCVRSTYADGGGPARRRRPGRTVRRRAGRRPDAADESVVAARTDRVQPPRRPARRRHQRLDGGSADGRGEAGHQHVRGAGACRGADWASWPSRARPRCSWRRRSTGRRCWARWPACRPRARRRSTTPWSPASRRSVTDGDRRIVVLSDGEDTRSRAPLEDALSATRASGVAVDAIGFNTGESVEAVLHADRRAADEGECTRRPRRRNCISAWRRQSDSRPRRWTCASSCPEDLRGEHTLALTATRLRGRCARRSPVTLGKPLLLRPLPPTGWWGTQDALLVGLVAIARASRWPAWCCSVAAGGVERPDPRQCWIATRPTDAGEGGRADGESRRADGARACRPGGQQAEAAGPVRDCGWPGPLCPSPRRSGCCCSPAFPSASALVLVLLGWNLLVAVLAGTVRGRVRPAAYLALRGGTPPEGLRGPAPRRTADGGRKLLRRLLTGSGPRRNRPRGQRADGDGDRQGARGVASRGARRETRWTGSPSGWTARTSAGSSWRSVSSAR